jgi:protein gp37
VLALPCAWSKPRMVFVNSMGDLFHEDVPLEFIRQVFDVMLATPRHSYQLLTKRAERLAEVVPDLPWPDNVWMGVTVEDSDRLARVERLREVPATVRFLSVGPLLGPLPDLDLAEIDWVIVGGESGPGARLMLKEWVVAIRDSCVGQAVPFFFRQWGGVRKKAAGRMLGGRIWSEMLAATSRSVCRRTAASRRISHNRRGYDYPCRNQVPPYFEGRNAVLHGIVLTLRFAVLVDNVTVSPKRGHAGYSVLSRVNCHLTVPQPLYTVTLRSSMDVRTWQTTRLPTRGVSVALQTRGLCPETATHGMSR